MGSWIEGAAHWRTVFKAAMELRRNPDPLFAELGRALHSYHVTHDRATLGETLVDIGERIKVGG